MSLKESIQEIESIIRVSMKDKASFSHHEVTRLPQLKNTSLLGINYVLAEMEKKGVLEFDYKTGMYNLIKNYFNG